MSDPIFLSPLSHPLEFKDLGEAPLLDIYPNVFYAVQSAGATSALFLVDITTGDKTPIPGGTLAFATFAIARDANTGRVYYVGTQSNGSAQVAYWNPATQTNTVLPNSTGQAVQFLKLAQAQDGTIYGLGSTANLYSINPTTGVATNLGAITGGSPAFTSGGGDAAFDPNDSNTLYISVVAAGQLRLYAVNVNTRTASYLGQSGLSSVTNSGSLAFGEDGELYAVATSASGTNFVRLSQADGSVSAVIKSNSEAYSDFSSLPTPTPDVDFTIVKTDGVDSIASGANTTYTISLTNNEGGGRVLGLIVKDSIPAGVVISAWQASITNGSGESAIVNGASGNSNEILTSINIGPNDTLTIVAQGTVVAAAGSVITSAVQVPGVNDISSGDILSDTTNVVENTAGVTLSAELIQVTEGGAMATYTVVLDSAPTSDVTITLNPGNQLSVNTPTLTFTPANFNIAQTVTVTAIDDPVGEGPHRGVISATVTSSDTNYNGVTVGNVVVQITDNDIPQQDPTFQTPQSNPFGLSNVGFNAAPTLADIDGDSDLDAFINSDQGSALFFENTGNASAPAFSAPQTNPFGLTDTGPGASRVLADIDGDGDLDIFIGDFYGDTLFYRNTGSSSSPAFAALSSNPFGLTSVGNNAAPTLADIDGDGDIDAFIGNGNGNTLFYRNTGSASSPVFAAPILNPFGLTNVGNDAKPTLADIDGDGDLDAFIGNSGDAYGNTLFFRNTGDAATPSFAAPTENPFGLTPVSVKSAPTFADIDGDGDLDAFIGDAVGDTFFFLNAPAPGVTLSAELIQVTEGGATATYTVVLDSAPSADVTITLNPGNQLSLDKTTFNFTPANFNAPQTVTVTALNDPIGEGPHRGAITATVASTDVNYNGLTVANVVAQITDNDIPQQDPTFQTPVTNPFGLTDVALPGTRTFADIDGDGDLDAFIGNQDGNTLFFENTGSASTPAFAALQNNPFGLTNVGVSAAPTFADIDGDGDLDAFVSEKYGTVFFENTGSASAPAFATPTANPFGLINTGSYLTPTFADIDGDGDLDAFIGERNGSTLFYENTGSVSAPAFAAPTVNPFGLTKAGNFAKPTFADIDGDGDLDAFIGNAENAQGDTLLFLNTGNASTPAFAAPTANPFGLTPVVLAAAPAFADIDGDGDLDAFIGDVFGNTLFFLNGLPPTPAGVTISAELIQVTEGGMMATYTVVLDSAPTDDVTITLNPGNQLSVNTPTLTFTPANFNIAQNVTVTAIDDPIGEGPHRGVITATVTSADFNYNGITVANVVAQITDNDIPQEDPTFQAPQTSPFGLTDVGDFSAPTFADIDGDGDLDAFIGDLSGDTLFFENVGTASVPAFAAPQTNSFGLTKVEKGATPTFADIDGDGDLDAFIGENYGNTLFFENTGSASSPAFSAPQTNPFGLTNVGYQATPTFADIDGDGDLDAFIGTAFGDTQFSENTGSVSTPAFAAPTENPFGLEIETANARPTFVDIDGDGDLDAFIGTADAGAGNTLFLRNTGSASSPAFAAPIPNPFGLIQVSIQSTPAFADIDGDGDLDAFIGDYSGDTFFLLNDQPLSLVVDTLVDENDGNFSAGDLSLREALARIADGGTITFANSLTGGTITLNGTDLLINKSLTLDGDINGDNGADITISGNNASRVFSIDDGDGGNLAQVELNALIITGGNTLVVGGAGILNRENLSFNNGAFTDNSDSSSVGGGGIANSGTATIVNSTLSGNFSEVRGGGIFNTGTAKIVNSTLSGNISGSLGGGIANSGTATLVNSTLSGNSAENVGGGIVNESGTTSLTSVIVANNTATSGGNDLLRSSGTINASNSLIEDNANQINGTNTNNIIGVDPLLGPLQNNGGPTQTLALLPGSPAIDAGSNPNNLTSDQRGAGFARSIGAGVDIGAVELQNQAPTVALNNQVNSLPENTATPFKVADILVTDDGVGTNNLSLTGADSALFEIQGTELLIKAGVSLDFETNPTLDVIVEVDDPTIGGMPDDTATFTLHLLNVIEGTPGKDRLSGTPNADIIDGLGGDDTLLGREQDDLIFGREGNDTIQGNNGNDIIFGGAGLDRLSGDNNDDQLFGEAGNDSLVGGNGNDLLVGGQGKDTLAGGAGADKFDYQNLGDSLLSGFDIITDFRGNDDKFLVANLPTLFTANAGKVSVLNAAKIGAILTPSVLANPGDAALFTNGNSATTYLGINGATPGFQANEDAILELRNFALVGTITAANFTLS